MRMSEVSAVGHALDRNENMIEIGCYPGYVLLAEGAQN